jgi:hypothetical protein
VEVRLIDPAETRRAGNPLSPRQVVRTLAPLFWDRDLMEEDLRQYPEWVVARVLMFGSRNEVSVVREFFDDSTIRRTLKRRGVDERTRNYWEVILGKECHASKGTRS